MYNLILDRYPDNYEGYLIRSDFRIGIQIMLALSDSSMGDEGVYIALNLLYGNGLPDPETALMGLSWFLNGGKIADNKESKEKHNPIFDFDADDSMFLSAFQRVYGIDLSKEKMHWFRFLALLKDIEGTVLAQVMEYRNVDLSKVPKHQRETYAKMKRLYSLKQPGSSGLSESDQKFVNQFIENAKIEKG